MPSNRHLQPRAALDCARISARILMRALETSLRFFRVARQGAMLPLLAARRRPPLFWVAPLLLAAPGSCVRGVREWQVCEAGRSRLGGGAGRCAWTFNLSINLWTFIDDCACIDGWLDSGCGCRLVWSVGVVFALLRRACRCMHAAFPAVHRHLIY